MACNFGGARFPNSPALYPKHFVFPGRLILLRHETCRAVGISHGYGSARFLAYQYRQSYPHVPFAGIVGTLGSLAPPKIPASPKVRPAIPLVSNHWTHDFLVPESWSLLQESLFGWSLKFRRARQ